MVKIYQQVAKMDEASDLKTDCMWFAPSNAKVSWDSLKDYLQRVCSLH